MSLKLSKYLKVVEIGNDEYAIFNSLIMRVSYVNSNELNCIKNFNVSEDDIDKFLQDEIYIEKDQDEDATYTKLTNSQAKISGDIGVYYLILTSNCNLACKYCFLEENQYNNSHVDYMSVETALKSMRKIDAYISEKSLSKVQIIFYGGEPLLNWDCIVACVEFGKTSKVDYEFSIVSNGIALEDSKIKFIVDNNIGLGISLDGYKELNDANRIYKQGTQSVYDDVMKNVTKLDLYNSNYGLSITMSEQFLDEQDKVLQWLKSLGNKNIFYNPLKDFSEEFDWEEYWARASAFLIKSHKILSQDRIIDGRFQRKIKSFFYNEFKYSDCAALGGNQLTIKPNGEIIVCHGYLKTDKYVMANINDVSIEEAVHNEEFNFWATNTTLLNNDCKECEAIYICGGGCPLQAESLFGDRSELDKTACVYSKSSLKWMLEYGRSLFDKIDNNERQ